MNLLLQVSRLLGRLREVGEEPGTFTLGVVHTDSLGARRGSDESFSELHPGQRADAALLASDERYGIVPLDAAKEPRFAEIRKDEAFDLIVGNPPYVSETGNRVLFERLRALPGWQDDHHGKSDYLYYFLAMAAEKVAPGGRLCVITPAGWMNAGNADWLRERIASSLRLDELYLFGSMRLFATEQQERNVRVGMTPPTVESAILLATKEAPAKNHRMRVVLLESETEAAVAITGDPTARVPPREQLLEVMATRAAGRVSRSKGILVHDVAQNELRSTRPWPIKHASRDVAARVVAHLQALLDAKSGPVEPLEEQWVVTRGIETGADAYSTRIHARLSEATRAQLEFQGVKPGDQILELSPGAEHQSPWREHPEALANSLEPRAILYGAIDADDAVHLVWMGSSDHEIPEITAALERYRPILGSRAGFIDSPGRRWWEAHRPRNKTLLRGPKVIALHRTDRGRFALDEAGVWQPSNKSTLVAPRTGGLSVAYLCGLLNSELLDLWYARRGRTPRDIWRDYEPKPMNEIPYRHLPTPEGWKPSPDVAVLAGALEAADTTKAVVAAGFIRAAVGTPAGDANAHNAIERLVRAIADNRRALLAFRAVAPELKRAIKNPWRTHGIEVDPAAVLAELSAGAVRSVRLDPELTVNITTDGVLGRARLEEEALVFTHSRRATARVDGPHHRVALLRDLLGTERLMPDDLLSARMPASLGAFSEEIARRQGEIDGLLEVGRELVEVVERLVCSLYGVPDALADLVVESAVTRAGTVAQQEE